LKIRRKLLLLMAGSAAAAGLLVGAGVAPMVSSAVHGRYVERLRAEADLLAGFAGTAGAGADYPALARDWGTRLDVRVSLIDRNGRVVGDSSAPDERLGRLSNHLDRPEMMQARTEGWGQAYRRSDSTGERYYYLARRLDGAGDLAFVRIALPAWEVDRAEAPYLGLITLLVVGAPFALALLAYGVVRRWSRPIEQLSSAAARVAAGELDLAIPAAREDEIGDMGRAAERMRRALTGKIHEVEVERRSLASVIAGMQEGLLLVDDHRKIRLVNEAFRRVFGLQGDPTGRPLVEVLRRPAVLAAVDAAFGGEREVHERIADPGEDRVYEIHAARLPAEKDQGAGVVVIFFDISRLERLEGLRKEFVANVSHELRTPLTSIKAAALTLLEDPQGPPEARERFLGTIQRNAERMAGLVEDLADLSLIETGAAKLDKRPLDVAALCRDVAAQLAPRYERLGLAVSVEGAEKLVVEADRRRLEQVVVNLVDNAMKFNRPGGSVKIVLAAAEGRAEIAVEDTGVGIPSTDVEKVFHRFHRVDPARSREVGGTGLGLAIVKHIVQQHGGTVRCESRLGEGSRFVVQLPA